jgi:2-polyprenyl-3-methyl-5-hydroxy-6-metoxy-1,4-benzoquinol methylase
MFVDVFFILKLLTMIEKDESQISAFYDDLSVRQKHVGINHRHLSIMKWCEELGLKPKHKVLELGCGIGTVSELLLRYLSTSGSLLAIDISERNIKVAKKRLPSKYKNANFILGDVLKLELNEKYDLILLPDVLEHIPSEKHLKLFLKLRDCLYETGFILIHIPDRLYQEWLMKNKKNKMQIIDQALYIRDLSQIMQEAGLKIVFLKSCSIYHKGFEYQVLKVVHQGISKYQFRENPWADSKYRRAKKRIQYLLRGFK